MLAKQRRFSATQDVEPLHENSVHSKWALDQRPPHGQHILRLEGVVNTPCPAGSALAQSPCQRLPYSSKRPLHTLSVVAKHEPPFAAYGFEVVLVVRIYESGNCSGRRGKMVARFLREALRLKASAHPTVAMNSPEPHIRVWYGASKRALTLRVSYCFSTCAGKDMDDWCSLKEAILFIYCIWGERWANTFRLLLFLRFLRAEIALLRSFLPLFTLLPNLYSFRRLSPTRTEDLRWLQCGIKYGSATDHVQAGATNDAVWRMPT